MNNEHSRGSRRRRAVWYLEGKGNRPAKAWIVVADAASARIMATTEGRSRITLIMRLAHADSRAKRSEMTADRAGRARKTAGRRSVFGMQPHSDPRQLAAENFASELAGKLQEGLEKGLFEEVALVAPARFVGVLTRRLNPQVRKRVLLRIEKDYTHVSDRLLPARLRSICNAMKTGEPRSAWM